MAKIRNTIFRQSFTVLAAPLSAVSRYTTSHHLIDFFELSIALGKPFNPLIYKEKSVYVITWQDSFRAISPGSIPAIAESRY
jgi:hypothetical protein